RSRAIARWHRGTSSPRRQGTSGTTAPPSLRSWRMSESLCGHRALVTGGTRGIGADIAHELSHQGASVVVTGRELRAAEQAAVSIAERTGGSVVGLQWAGEAIDLDADANALLADAAGALGGIDILVNNAGVIERGPARAMSTPGWERL